MLTLTYPLWPINYVGKRVPGEGLLCYYVNPLGPWEDMVENFVESFHDKSTLVQVMCWCRQTTSHSQCCPRSVSQCCPRFMSPYGVTRPKWLDIKHLCIAAMSNLMISNESPVYITDAGTNKCTTVRHYNDVIMTTMASQITNLTVVYSPAYSDADLRKHHCSASLAFVWGTKNKPLSFLCFMPNRTVDKMICQWNLNCIGANSAMV